MKSVLATVLCCPARPTWWNRSLPYPAIGPDVIGGSGPGGHAYANWAMQCYNQTPKDGAGMIRFNPKDCYGVGTAREPDVSAPRR